MRNLPAPMLLTAALLSSCVSVDRVDVTSASLPDALQTLAQRHHICAVTLAVIKNRKLDSLVSATGCASTPTPRAGSVFQAASLSKPVFAYAVMGLAAQGKLDLDAPVVKYLPQGYRHQFDPLKAEPSELVTDARLAAITVRMALNHTSGLPNWAGGPLRVDGIPGTAWRYSGEGYVLLQRAVEAVTGQPLDRFMASQVFAPLGMTRSDYVWNERFAQDFLRGTKANGSPRTVMDLRNPVAAFSLYTTAADYAKFVVTLLNDERALQQATASPVPVDRSLGISWGLGWGVEHDRGDSYIWQWGNNTGYRAFVMASVRTGDGFVMLTNSENGLALAEPMTRKLLPGEHQVFQFPSLGIDVINVLCTRLRVCF